jgi:hypothetical protein
MALVDRALSVAGEWAPALAESAFHWFLLGTAHFLTLFSFSPLASDDCVAAARFPLP